MHGRRARRFSLGAEIPDGPLAFRSRHEPMPLTDLERMLVLTSAAGNTGWHYAITRNATYAPNLPNYSGAAGGRTFPSAAGFHVSEVFFTDDEGVYLFETRDAPKLVEREPGAPVDVDAVIEAHRSGSASSPTGGCTSRRRSPTWRGTTRGASTCRGACC